MPEKKSLLLNPQPPTGLLTVLTVNRIERREIAGKQLRGAKTSPGTSLRPIELIMLIDWHGLFICFV
jgi:hypothetical protein